MSGKRPRIPPEEYAAYLRLMAQQQRELAEEFDRSAERAEKAAFGQQPEADRGHTFRITFSSRGSYTVTGDEHHTDAPHFDEPSRTVEVRAWNLREALAKAACLPLSDWFDEDQD
jgi:hypothetical protein